MGDYWEDNNIEKPQAIVVCAACKHPTRDLLLASPRHWDGTMRKQYGALKSAARVNSNLWEQGFVNQSGEFLTRKEAMIIAKSAGQKIDIEKGCGGHDEILFSEGLY